MNRQVNTATVFSSSRLGRVRASSTLLSLLKTQVDGQKDARLPHFAASVGRNSARPHLFACRQVCVQPLRFRPVRFGFGLSCSAGYGSALTSVNAGSLPPPHAAGCNLASLVSAHRRRQSENGGAGRIPTGCGIAWGVAGFYQPTLRSESRVELARTLPSREEEKTA
jgi:hypothetical protein